MRVVLYDYWRSSAAYRVRIALNLKQVAYERVAVDLLAGEQGSADNRARNPQGLVPTLEVDGRAMTQSLAIVDWLDATFPDPPLVAADPVVRQRQLARALVVAADVHPLNNLRVLQRLKGLDVDQAARDAWYRHWVTEGFAALEALAEGAGPFLGGGTAPDLSDLCLVPQMYNARRFEVPLDACPRLVAADAAMAAIAAVADAHPDRVRP